MRLPTLWLPTLVKTNARDSPLEIHTSEETLRNQRRPLWVAVPASPVPQDLGGEYCASHPDPSWSGGAYCCVCGMGFRGESDLEGQDASFVRSVRRPGAAIGIGGKRVGGSTREWTLAPCVRVGVTRQRGEWIDGQGEGVRSACVGDERGWV